MKRCPSCQRTYSDEQTFCPDDGERLTSSAASNDPGDEPFKAATGGSAPTPGGYGPAAAPDYQPPPPPGMFPPAPPPGGPMGGGTTSKLQPALIGGVLLGVLAIGTVLVPIPQVTWCCCVWGVLGGVLASYMYIKRSPTQVRMGEGAILGLMAGGVGALIYALVAFPLTYFTLDPEIIQAQIEDRLRESGTQFDIRPYWAWFLLLSIFMAGLLLASLSLIGGIIGVPVFEKRQDAAAPPPPPPLQNPGTGYS